MKDQTTMTLRTLVVIPLATSLLAGCGGGATGTGPVAGGMTNAPAPTATPAPGTSTPPPPVAPSVNYATLSSNSGSSPLSGAVLASGTSVADTSGTITHNGDTFTASGISGTQSLSVTSAFNLPTFTYATDVQIDAGTVAIVGIATESDDIRPSGSAAYSGTFAAQLVDASSPTATTLNWDADVQVDFSGNGDVDMTFFGGGSDLIDTIRVNNARISGGGFEGGSIQTLNNGTRNDITGSNATTSGAFFGYNDVLLHPAEIGGALQSSDSDTDISGVFLTRIQP